MSKEQYKPQEPIEVDESIKETNRAKPTRPSKLVDWLYPSFETVEKVWDSILAAIRSLLPEAWNQKLSDWGLTGAIAAFIVVIMVTAVAITPETPTQLAKEVKPEPIPAPAELAAPEFSETPEPNSSPLELTPEQRLITAIQDQVAEITAQYANGLIQSIQANFQGNRLIVTMSDGWYKLDEQEQQQLASEIWRRSQDLELSKLEITNSDGSLLARSPVVGSGIVIWQR
ncbi:MAG: hypothetical protein RH949_31940 [Coleofasciculus sp. A1-SPW-01]|uniref:hypothetical protein n=1 Tax=Coleofasciculus sp. A1-SPW-01 TaxID=3070819 RepID=UPI00330166A8